MPRDESSPVSAAHSAAVGIIPVGLCGALTTTRRVAGVSAPSRRGTSSDQPSVSCSSWSVTSAPFARPTSYRLW